MAAKFLYGKWIKWGVAALSAVVFMWAAGYSLLLSKIKTVPMGTNFYFLVSEDTHVEAGAEFVKLGGGAGYLLEYENREYAVLSVYLKQSDGEAVQASLFAQGESTEMITIHVDSLCFKTTSDKKDSNMYVGALRSLYGCMTVLEGCVARLEKGMTQEQCKRLLFPLQRQFGFLSKSYEKEYPSFSRLCKQTARKLADLGTQTLYVKDLRYMLCELADNYTQLSAVFSL